MATKRFLAGVELWRSRRSGNGSAERPQEVYPLRYEEGIQAVVTARSERDLPLLGAYVDVWSRTWQRVILAVLSYTANPRAWRVVYALWVVGAERPSVVESAIRYKERQHMDGVLVMDADLLRFLARLQSRGVESRDIERLASKLGNLAGAVLDDSISCQELTYRLMEILREPAGDFTNRRSA